MPLPPHERYKKYLARLVELATEELEVVRLFNIG
jgi:hypothetical protein